ncbi:phage tail tape measure protein [Lichenihabitans sp. Uapishka_5]|uniref:phage tail tape measure protein n=1 Tax=Lichenihabitans sp. Uapishka_5 TaxID=3037302 RepID=UPI0029E7D5EB|nr:phage tail tape measure protein [Lichenihabitans sp. Uapishka_5]MDX7950479.1 phage tail tape measure protein [Lichenihabitans sp. Uapishka_5]
MAILESEVVLTGKDAGVAAMFENIGRKLDAMGKAAKISPEFEKLAGTLQKAEAQLKAIDKYNTAKSTSALARGTADDARRKVTEAKAAIEAMSAPTKRATADLERLQAAEGRAIEQYRRRATATLEARSALSGLSISAERAGAAEVALRGKVEATTAALERQVMVERRQVEQGAARAKQMAAQAQVSRRGGHGDSTLAGLAGMYIGHEVGHVGHQVIERYAEFDKERRYGKVVMGLTDEQQEPLVRQAIRGGANSRFNDIQWLESQRELAARGYNRDQVMAFTPIAAQLGQVFDKSMPEGVKALEGALLGFKKDTSTPEAAMASAQRTADLQTKASKISGMDYEDVVAAYKYAAAPAQMAHLSEEQMLAFAAISKKSNMGGDESGVAFRALAKNLMTPTAGAQIAMRASGINYNSYQRMPDRLDTGGFVDSVAKNYGVKLDQKATAAIEKIFTNKALIGNATAFMPAMREVLGNVLGGDDAKSKGKIAGLARNYRDASVKSIDTDGLMTAIMTGMSKNPALANAIFGSKQGGRIFAALGDPKYFAHVLDELQHHSQGFGKTVADARMEGFNGAVQKLQASIMVAETAIGRSLDGGGKGGLMTDATNIATGALQAFAEATPQIHQLAAAGGAAAAAWGAIKGFNLLSGGFGLKGSATALDAAAAHLMEVGMPGHGGPGGGMPGEAGPGGGKKLGLGAGRLAAAAIGAAPTLMEAYDYSKMSPEERKAFDEKRFAEGHAAAVAAGNVVRSIRDRLGLRTILPFSDDNLDEGNEPSIRARAKTMARGAGWHAALAAPPINDPYLGGERQAIDERARRGALDFRQDPEGARGRAYARLPGNQPTIGAPLDIRPQAQRDGMQTVDVTGKVSSDVSVTTGGTIRVDVQASPELLAKVGFQGIVTNAVAKPSTGASMPNAGVAPHVSRRDE